MPSYQAIVLLTLKIWLSSSKNIHDKNDPSATLHLNYFTFTLTDWNKVETAEYSTFDRDNNFWLFFKDKLKSYLCDIFGAFIQVVRTMGPLSFFSPLCSHKCLSLKISKQPKIFILRYQTHQPNISHAEREKVSLNRWMRNAVR